MHPSKVFPCCKSHDPANTFNVLRANTHIRHTDLASPNEADSEAAWPFVALPAWLGMEQSATETWTKAGIEDGLGDHGRVVTTTQHMVVLVGKSAVAIGG
jgi:hypothetical protein